MRFVFATGIVLLTLGLVAYYSLPALISIYIDNQIALKQNSQSYPLWRQLPVPIYQKFYFYNVTNAQQIEQFGHKPVLDEIGPFTYRLDIVKDDIEADDLESTIRFSQFKAWFFEPSMSIADHRLQLVTLNAPLAITLSLIQTSSAAIRYIVTFSLDGLSEGFFTKRTVKQLLFDGYPDLLTTFGPLLNAEMLSQGGHFGYMNARNGSLDAKYEVYTGADSVAKLNTLQKFNGEPKLDYWTQEGQCNSLEGATIGEMFPPLPTANVEGLNATRPTLRLFQADFCRVWPLNFDSDIENHSSGLALKRFVASRDVLRNSTDLPANACFFPTKTPTRQQPQQQNQRPLLPHRPAAAAARRPRQEWPAGVFTLAPCKFNAPIYMSLPHYLDAEPFFASQVSGLSADRNLHEFHIDIEPRTGSPVQVNARVQLNVAISKPSGLVRFRNIPEIMFPVFWQELNVNVTGEVIDQLILASKRPAEATLLISYTLFYSGALLLILASVFYMHSSYLATQKKDPTIKQETSISEQ